MKHTPLSLILICAWLLSTGAASPSPRLAPDKTIYADALAPGWENWSWAQVDLNAASPVHAGSRSIQVTFGAWTGLYLHNAGLDTLGTTHLRFFVHGGGTGGQKMNVFLNLQVGGANANGPAVAVTPPQAGAWLEVQVPLSQLNPGGAAVTGVTWQGSTNGSQPAVYIDDIALAGSDSPDGPQLFAAGLVPRSLPADGRAALVVRVRTADPQGPADVASVSLDASRLGRGTVALHDDGRSSDGQAGDGLYGAVLSAAPGTPPGEVNLLLTASDTSGHATSLPLGALGVLAPPGGAVPAALPQRIGWGSNAWQSWQAASGVPWDYTYQYITWNWETWGGSFVSRFVHQAWDEKYIPMVTVYMILGLPPECGETPACYAQKLQNAGAVGNYIASLRRAAQEASGSKPVIFNLEPDFYGYMQQLSNSASRPAGVRPDDPASYPVALNIGGYPNTLAGFGRYLVDLVHSTAPNALVAPMASAWATNGDPQSVTASEAIEMGRRTAAYIDAMGGAGADLLVVEWSDRDSGSGLRPWWDDTDQQLPRPTRALLWENALSRAANKRLLLWQVPVGNMALDDTCDRYRDNRAAYLFNHPHDLVDAGVTGVLFGGGASCMTQVGTDGGFVASQGALAYAAPPAPSGLSAGPASGVFAPLRWDEPSAPDLWGYRVVFQPAAGGTVFIQDTGRRNAVDLLLPHAGTWQVRVRAVDAMGNESSLSAPVVVTTLVDASQVFLPLLRKGQ